MKKVISRKQMATIYIELIRVFFFIIFFFISKMQSLIRFVGMLLILEKIKLGKYVDCRSTIFFRMLYDLGKHPFPEQFNVGYFLII